jgi:Polyketide cyclase / dehydrase and lipid transport
MRHFSETIDIARPLEDVWRTIGTPERWFDGYLEIRQRSPDYPAPQTRDDHVYRTRKNEKVDARVTRSDAPRMLEEVHEGQTFSRHLRYSLSPSSAGTSVRVDDDVSFKGLGRLAAAIATRDIKHRWHTSLVRLKATVEGEPPTQAAQDHASHVTHP